jgi:iron complex transport system ATP-binding protein
MGRAPHSRGRAFENAHDLDVAWSMLALTDISHLAHQPITALSGGERQRAFIARALAQQPQVLLLDEPNAHLDIAHQVEIFTLIKRLNRESGLTVVSVSHDLNLAAAYSDRIAMMVRGSIAAAGAPEEVLTASRIQDVFRTPVLVDTHPSGNSMRVTLIPSQPVNAHTNQRGVSRETKNHP